MECSGVFSRLGVLAATGWLLLALSLCALPALAGTDAALAWLGRQSQADGSYFLPGGVATPAQATAEALRALPPGAAAPASLQFLDAAASAGPTEYLARALLAHAGASGSSALKAALEAGQNPDGGFGGAPGFSSTVLDTAYALQALAGAGGGGRAAAALAYLLGRQGADGGFPLDGGAQGSVHATAAALMALHAHRLSYDLAGPVARAAGFLLAARTGGGSWGGDFEAAWALLALVPATTDGAVLAPAARALEAAQLADGSWGGDVYLTALAARALGALRGSAGDPPPWDGVVAGRVVDQAGGRRRRRPGGRRFPCHGGHGRRRGLPPGRAARGLHARRVRPGVPGRRRRRHA